MTAFRRCTRFAAGLVALAVIGRSGQAQVLRGTVRDSVTRYAIPGSVVSVLDSSGKTLARVLSNERGEFGVARSALAVGIRVQRLGFRMREIGLPSFSGDTALTVALLALPALLDPVRVVANVACPQLANQDDVFGLLQAAQDGVLTTVVGREANPGTLVRSEYERRIDPVTGRAISQTVQRDSAIRTAASFFTARTGDEFVRLGFTDPKPGGSDYMGMTADLLLDSGFTTGYCFHIAAGDPKRPNQIGLAFATPSHKTGRVDVEGTLWMDTVTRSLRDMEYRYVARSFQAIRATGRTSFLEMANGVVLVDRWSITMQGMRWKL
jgi:hypothetical protein